MAITKQQWDKDATILSTLIGRRILDIDYDGNYSGSITLKLNNGKSVTIDAEGDDMAHTVVSD